MTSHKDPQIFTRAPGRPAEIRMLCIDLQSERDEPTFRLVKAALARDWGLDETKNFVLELTGNNGRFLGEDRGLIVSTHKEWRKIWGRLKGTKETIIITMREAPKKLTQKSESIGRRAATALSCADSTCPVAYRLKCANETLRRLEAMTEERNELKSLASRQASKLAELETVLSEHNSLKTLASSQALKLSQLQQSEKARKIEVQGLHEHLSASNSALSLTRSTIRASQNLKASEEALRVKVHSLEKRLLASQAETSHIRSILASGYAVASAKIIAEKNAATRQCSLLKDELKRTESALESLKRSYKLQFKELKELKKMANPSPGCSIQ